MTRAEQETIFRYAADETVVSIFSAHPPTARKLERFGYHPYKTSTSDGEISGWFFKIPLSEFRWRAGKRRPQTDAQRAARGRPFVKARLTRDSREDSAETSGDSSSIGA
jgi:hypothetical protein